MGFNETYRYILYDSIDPGLKDTYFYYSFSPILTILLAYWYFVRVLGPKIMEDREPCKIVWLISIYNVIQVIWNAYMFSYNTRYIITEYIDKYPKYSLWCFPTVLTADTDIAEGFFQTMQMYLFNKFFDLSETIFFVLRKKYKQITYLHLFHHIAMCSGIWLGIRYEAGGNPSTIGVFNTAVHAVMYIYYQLALMGCTKWLWWKKYLTQLQIIQFVCVVIHSSSVYFQPRCQYSRVTTSLATLQAVYFIYLFGIYYLRAYVLKKEKKK